MSCQNWNFYNTDLGWYQRPAYCLCRIFTAHPGPTCRKCQQDRYFLRRAVYYGFHNTSRREILSGLPVLSIFPARICCKNQDNRYISRLWMSWKSQYKLPDRRKYGRRRSFRYFEPGYTIKIRIFDISVAYVIYIKIWIFTTKPWIMSMTDIPVHPGPKRRKHWRGRCFLRYILYLDISNILALVPRFENIDITDILRRYHFLLYSLSLKFEANPGPRLQYDARIFDRTGIFIILSAGYAIKAHANHISIIARIFDYWNQEWRE